MTLYRKIVLEGESSGPRLLIVAGVHGDECEPMVAVRQLADELHGHDFNGTVTLVPVANVSACRCAARVGEDQLDLARTFPGKSSGSVTEQLAAQLHEEIAQADYLIDLHTGGKHLDIAPMTGFQLHKRPEVLSMQRLMAAAFGLPYVWGTSCDLDGRTLSSARDANVPAIYAEYGGGGSFRGEIVERYVAGCLNVISALGMAVPATTARGAGSTEAVSSGVDAKGARLAAAGEGGARFFCDDSAASSGYLQVCHPAPCDGVFVADVRLGDKVSQGEVVGRVVDMTSGEEAAIKADRDGIVLALFCQSQVRAKTGVCVVVDFREKSEVRA